MSGDRSDGEIDQDHIENEHEPECDNQIEDFMNNIARISLSIDDINVYKEKFEDFKKHLEELYSSNKYKMILIEVSDDRTDRNASFNEDYQKLFIRMKDIDTKIPLLLLLGYEEEVALSLMKEMKKISSTVCVLPGNSQSNSYAGHCGMMGFFAILTEICLEAGFKRGLLNEEQINKKAKEHAIMKNYC